MIKSKAEGMVHRAEEALHLKEIKAKAVQLAIKVTPVVHSVLGAVSEKTFALQERVMRAPNRNDYLYTLLPTSEREAQAKEMTLEDDFLEEDDEDAVLLSDKDIEAKFSARRANSSAVGILVEI